MHLNIGDDKEWKYQPLLNDSLLLGPLFSMEDEISLKTSSTDTWVRSSKTSTGAVGGGNNCFESIRQPVKS